MANSKQTFAFDFDDTLCETTRAFLEFNKVKYGLNVQYSDVQIDLYKTLEISEDEEIKRWNEFFDSPEFCFPPPTSGLADLLSSIKNKYKLVILTARSKAWENQIPAWINEYLPDIFDEIIFTENLGWKDAMKGIVCNKMKIGMLVDDEPPQIASCLKAGVKVFVFDRPWNKNVSNGAVRITAISEIRGYLK